jgi:hypothetical protein
MKKVKRESVRKVELNVEPPSTSRYRIGGGGKKSDPDVSRNTSGSKSYRITTADSQRLVTSPSVTKMMRSTAYDPSIRKYSGPGDIVKQSSKLR